MGRALPNILKIKRIRWQIEEMEVAIKNNAENPKQKKRYQDAIDRRKESIRWLIRCSTKRVSWAYIEKKFNFVYYLERYYRKK